MSSSSAFYTQKFVEKMEKLQKMIDNQGSGIVGNSFLITNEDFAAGMMLPDEIDSTENSCFSMFIDSWGTSERKVGP